MGKSRIEKIDSIADQIAQLENVRKQLIQQQREQDRKERTKRLCRRMGLLESLLPDTITLTEEQFKTFLEKTVTTDHSRRILNGLATHTNTPTMPKTAEAEQKAATNGGKDGGKVTGEGG